MSPWKRREGAFAIKTMCAVLLETMQGTFKAYLGSRCSLLLHSALGLVSLFLIRLFLVHHHGVQDFLLGLCSVIIPGVAQLDWEWPHSRPVSYPSYLLYYLSGLCYPFKFNWCWHSCAIQKGHLNNLMLFFSFCLFVSLVWFWFWGHYALRCIGDDSWPYLGNHVVPMIKS